MKGHHSLSGPNGKRRRARLLQIAAMLLSISGSSVHAGDKYNITPKEHEACDGDAERLCSAAYPDPDKLIDCMKSNKTNLTAACRSTFEAGMRKRHLAL